MMPIVTFQLTTRQSPGPFCWFFDSRPFPAVDREVSCIMTYGRIKRVYQVWLLVQVRRANVPELPIQEL